MKIICAKHIYGRNTYVRSKFSCMRSSHGLCAHAHMHSLEGTLLITSFFFLLVFRIYNNIIIIIIMPLGDRLPALGEYLIPVFYLDWSALAAKYDVLYPVVSEIPFIIIII